MKPDFMISSYSHQLQEEIAMSQAINPVASMMHHVTPLNDPRQSRKVIHPLNEILFLVRSGKVA